MVRAIPHSPQVTAAAERGKGGAAVVRWVTSNDQRVLPAVLITSFAFFLFGGLMAMVMRAELARHGSQIVSNEQSAPRCSLPPLRAASHPVSG